tara:strand:+ start:88344 stop:88766 length:423 start_codon:yes stop_codon:yes gene_type:complete
MKNKLLRSELKNIVKECLVEILSEGLSSDLTSLVEKNKTKLNESLPPGRRIPKLKDSRASNEPILNRHVEIANSLTDDPILASVLAESHETVKNQNNAEKAGINAMAGDSAARVAATSDPMEIFGESAGQWAQLAFSDSK